jgi:superfamily II RNA helicase
MANRGLLKVSCNLIQDDIDVLMHPVTSLLCALSLATIAYSHPETYGNLVRAATNSQGTCRQIARAISNASEMFFSRTCSLSPRNALRAEQDMKLIPSISPIIHMSIRPVLRRQLAPWSPAQPRM